MEGIELELDGDGGGGVHQERAEREHMLFVPRCEPSHEVKSSQVIKNLDLT
jgi:hypothetical protein